MFRVTFVLASIVINLLINPCLGREFQFLNNRGDTIWVGILGNPGNENLEGGGFVLGPGEQRSIQSADNWGGRFWGRTGCDDGSQHCLTGDCGNQLQCNGNGGAPPVTLAEITLQGSDGLDFYDVSLVDGFNIPLSFEPLGGNPDGSQYSCTKDACLTNINANCPEELQLKDESGQVIGCKSACLAFDTDLYCCRGPHDLPETCKESDFPVDYPAFFKEQCPDAYSYAYDDHKSTFTCNAPAYLITFAS